MPALAAVVPSGVRVATTTVPPTREVQPAVRAFVYGVEDFGPAGRASPLGDLLFHLLYLGVAFVEEFLEFSRGLGGKGLVHEDAEAPGAGFSLVHVEDLRVEARGLQVRLKGPCPAQVSLGDAHKGVAVHRGLPLDGGTLAGVDEGNLAAPALTNVGEILSPALWAYLYVFFHDFLGSLNAALIIP